MLRRKKRRIAHRADSGEASAIDNISQEGRPFSFTTLQSKGAQANHHHHQHYPERKEAARKRVRGLVRIPRIRLRVVCLFKKMKESWSSFVSSKDNSEHTISARTKQGISSPVYSSYHDRVSHHADAIADCIEFIKRSSSVSSKEPSFVC